MLQLPVFFMDGSAAAVLRYYIELMVVS